MVVEYGKDPANEKNLVCCYTVTNHSNQSAKITVLPQFLLPGEITPNKYVLEIILTAKGDIDEYRYIINVIKSSFMKRGVVFYYI